ncbi:MAG: hypothetical protein NVS2B9_03940 [Myxococcales bacterium]
MSQAGPREQDRSTLLPRLEAGAAHGPVAQGTVEGAREGLTAGAPAFQCDLDEVPARAVA